MPSSRFLLERTQPKVHGDWLTVQIIIRKRKQEDNCQTVLIFQCKPFSHSEVSSTSLLASCHSATSVSQNKISLLTDTRNISIQKMPLKFSFQQVMRTDAIHNWLQWEAQCVNSNNFWTAWGSIYATQLKSVLMLQELSLGISSRCIHSRALQSPSALLLWELNYSSDSADR